MKKHLKKQIKKILPQRATESLKHTRNNLIGIYKYLNRRIYSDDIFKLALLNLVEDSGASPQVFKYNNENIYFNSWKNSFVGHILREIYIDGIHNWFFKDQKNLVVVDLGANVGFFTQFARRFAKRIIAVEPSAETAGYLKRAKEENGWGNVEIANVAISTRTENQVTFFHNRSNTTMYSLNPEMSDGSSSEKVDTISFPDLFKKYNLEHVDFLKIDVEGSELEIIKDEGFKKILPLVDVIELELHFGGERMNEVFRLLNNYGLNVKLVETTARVYAVTKM